MNRPTLWMDVGTLMGGIVGKTEENTRLAFAMADAMEPCDLCLDEVEKGMGGRGGEHDGGVNLRFKGAFLTWQNDHTTDVWLGMTSNDISKLPPELTRSERIDAIWFFDLPSRVQKDSIWGIFMGYFGLKEQHRPDDSFWTGAEIRGCCRLAALRRTMLVDAARQIVPVWSTWKDKIDSLRQWANKKCLDAETGELFCYSEKKNSVAVPEIPAAKVGEKVRRRTS
jgi:SpoVK/Ycf46/Vps4 family AAA+-type ATPase